MKIHVPADIDALMWSVAESGDEQAIEEFGIRHSQYRLELLKRMDMVRQLRGAKPDQIFVGAPPKFSPKESAAPVGFRKWAWVVAPVLLAGVAFGSYNVAIQYMRPAAKSAPIEPAPIPVDSGLVDPLPDNVEAPQGTGETFVPPIDETPKETTVAPYDVPITLKAKKVSLHAAIDLIGKSSSLAIELAPGLEDIDISMDYANISAKDILIHMGKNFGFTVFEQEPGRVLIVPEVDPNKQNGDPVEPVNPSKDSIRPETSPDQKLKPRSSSDN